jgi:chromosomal replication initiation ATPase DnaA
MYLVRKIEGVSYPGIGHQFGGRDHTTIIAGIRDVDRLIEAGDNKTIKALHFVQARMGA